MAWAGDHERALETATSITLSRRRSAALAIVAAALVEHGHPKQAAEVTVRAVASLHVWYKPAPSPARLLAITRTLAELGETERAIELVQRAEEIARSLVDPDHYCRALAEVAAGFASVREFDQAKELARSLAGTSFHGDAMAAIARAMAKAGDHVGVRRIMRLVTDSVHRHDFAASYAVALVKSGRLDKALQHVEHMADNVHLAEVAAVLAEAGHHAPISAIVDRFLNGIRHYGLPWNAGTWLRPIVIALVAMGEHRRADEMTLVLKRRLAENERSKVLAALTGQGDAGLLIEGMNLASTSAFDDGAMLAVARTLTTDNALERIDDVGSVYLRARAALALARAFHERGDDRNAGMCAAYALRLVEWEENLEQLAFVSADAALAMVDEAARLAQ
jgi:tetratricopeptide (TPR) repeat protein